MKKILNEQKNRYDFFDLQSTDVSVIMQIIFCKMIQANLLLARVFPSAHCFYSYKIGDIIFNCIFFQVSVDWHFDKMPEDGSFHHPSSHYSKYELEPDKIDQIKKATNGNFALGTKRSQDEISIVINRNGQK